MTLKVLLEDGDHTVYSIMIEVNDLDELERAMEDTTERMIRTIDPYDER